MEENKKEVTVEQLQEENKKLKEQMFYITQQVDKANTELTFTRINFLFNILKYKDCFNTEQLISVSDEIYTILMGKAEDKNPEGE